MEIGNPQDICLKIINNFESACKIKIIMYIAMNQASYFFNKKKKKNGRMG